MLFIPYLLEVSHLVLLWEEHISESLNTKWGWKPQSSPSRWKHGMALERMQPSLRHVADRYHPIILLSEKLCTSSSTLGFIQNSSVSVF